MPNPYVNKVQKSNGDILIDLSTDTVESAADIIAGKVGHLRDGSVVTGTGQGGGSSGVVYIIDETQLDGSTVRNMDTTHATVTTTTDALGGTVYNITGEEVYLQIKHVTPTGQRMEITADQGYDALFKVIIEPQSGTSAIVGEAIVGQAVIGSGAAIVGSAIVGQANI